MSSPVNLQRDAVWADGDDTNETAWSNGKTITTGEANTAGPAAVNTKTGFVKADVSATTGLTAGTAKGIGVFMEPPLIERVPYRIKAFASADAGDSKFWINIGYPAVAPIGTLDTIYRNVRLPFVREFDGYVLCLPLPTTDPYYGNPLSISIQCSANSGATAELLFGTLSVQNMAVAPLAFAQSVG